MIVKCDLHVSNFHSEMSIVIPRSLFGLSLTHAYLNEPLTSCCDSFSNFSTVRSSMPPHLSMRGPVIVNLPKSTWPKTTVYA